MSNATEVSEDFERDCESCLAVRFILYSTIYLSFLPCIYFILFSCSRWSFVDVPLVFSYVADHVIPDWQPRYISGYAEA